MNLYQQPATGQHLIRYRGDTITFSLKNETDNTGQAWLRSNVGHANIRYNDIIAHAEEGKPPLSNDWHDYPMEETAPGEFTLTLPLLEVGRFEAKAFFIPKGETAPVWPEGANTVLKVEPASTCSYNTMYTAFVRQFGAPKSLPHGAIPPEYSDCIEQMDQKNFTVIPPSGKFRDLIKELDFIIGTMRCRIIQLLPIHPTPTTYARMGRYGSPFAVMDLFDVDPSLAEFDRQSTPLDQFMELVNEIHCRKGQIFLDMPINHTGWASHLQVVHPEWFARSDDDTFLSPGAWGITWEDLSKLDYSHRELWQYMADVFLYWCEKGVDGFRCDAGYKIPFDAWKYIIAKVRLQYPNTIFMLEGLGGSKDLTEHLLSDSGMNWAYSELFQNYSQEQVEQYLPDSIRVAATKGNLIHFSETHDNSRLAAVSPTFARLRTAFCALASYNGTFGFANGVEWLATEQINVHNSHSLNWGSNPNLVDLIQRLHAILQAHPSFNAGAVTELIEHGHHNSVALLRTDASSKEPMLILANLNHEQKGMVCWEKDRHPFSGKTAIDLLSGNKRSLHSKDHLLTTSLQPGEVLCLVKDKKWNTAVDEILQQPFNGDVDTTQQELKAKMLDVFCHFKPIYELDEAQISPLVEQLCNNPKAFCTEMADHTPCVTTWSWPSDTQRTVMLPPGHFLLMRAPVPFSAQLSSDSEVLLAEKSLPANDGTCFILLPPQPAPKRHRTLTLNMTLLEPENIQQASSSVLQLAEEKNAVVITSCETGELLESQRHAICTNNHGALAQVRMAWAELASKYDALLAANLHPGFPVDRHIMLTRCRGWVLNRGYSNELNLLCQNEFSVADDGTVRWKFEVPAGEGKTIPLEVALRMHPDANAVRLTYKRPKTIKGSKERLDDATPITLIIRPDLEDRCNHEITKAFTGPEEHWANAIEARNDGFTFAPAHDRKLHLYFKNAAFHHASEWQYMVHHPVDAERGIDGSTDLFSPGYFELELKGGDREELTAWINQRPNWKKVAANQMGKRSEISIEEAMHAAMRQFIVKRDRCKTVIAGYPWFLDWGRDTLICLRGIIAAGYLDESREIIRQFALFEKGGTIPNMIRGDDDRNRETSDAPLWLYVAAQELMDAEQSDELLEMDCDGRTLRDVLVSLGTSLINGTENGITFDWESGLLFSPSHFTWMDTNYPAGTPREGYPIEIQALWFYALRMLSNINDAPEWPKFSKQVQQSIHSLYVISTEKGETYLADNLAATHGTSAQEAQQDDALRCNQLLAITLGAIDDPALCHGILDACETLLIPGAIRSLADRPVKHPAPIYNDGHLLNDPHHPYWGHYSGDEDTRRKPAYHNGTAWTWPFPSYAEALVKVYGKKATPTAQALLGSASQVINLGCLRQVPEIIEGNTPHHQRGCGAQAWGVTELYRLLKQLKG